MEVSCKKNPKPQQEEDDAYCAFKFETNGREVLLLGPGKAGELAKTTGWTTWDTAYVLIAYLQKYEYETICRNDTLVVDISTGNGLVALSCAAMGAKNVIATDLGTCSCLTAHNVDLNRRRRFDDSDSWSQNVLVYDYSWGQDTFPWDESDQCSLVFICDALFIAIRDEIEDLLMTTILRICLNQFKKNVEDGRLYFAYEERLCTREMAFMERLQRHEQLQCCEIESNRLDLNAAQRASTFVHGVDTSIDTTFVGVENMFYEPPQVRLWVISLKT